MASIPRAVLELLASEAAPIRSAEVLDVLPIGTHVHDATGRSWTKTGRWFRSTTGSEVKSSYLVTDLAPITLSR